MDDKLINTPNDDKQNLKSLDTATLYQTIKIFKISPKFFSHRIRESVHKNWVFSAMLYLIFYFLFCL